MGRVDRKGSRGRGGIGGGRRGGWREEKEWWRRDGGWEKAGKGNVREEKGKEGRRNEHAVREERQWACRRGMAMGFKIWVGVGVAEANGNASDRGNRKIDKEFGQKLRRP